MKVVSPEDVLKGKIWAYSDEDRRKSRHQKDLADLMRPVESYPGLFDMLPEKINSF